MSWTQSSATPSRPRSTPRGDGRATEAERKLGYCDESSRIWDVAARRGDNALPANPSGYYELGSKNIQGLCYPDLADGVDTTMRRIAGLLNAFHRGA